MTPAVLIAPTNIRLSKHAAERLHERVGGDADSFLVEVSASLAAGRYRPAWRRGYGVFVTTERAAAFVDVSSHPAVIVTTYPVTETLPAQPRAV